MQILYHLYAKKSMNRLFRHLNYNNLFSTFTYCRLLNFVCLDNPELFSAKRQLPILKLKYFFKHLTAKQGAVLINSLLA